MQTLENLLTQFSTAFYSDRYQEQLSLDSSISALLSENPSFSEVCQSNLEYSKFKEDSQFFEQSLVHLCNADWEPVSNYNDISVETHYSGADFYTRASVVIDASIFEVLCVINEEDLLPSWIHALSQVNVLSSPANFKKLMKYSFWFPWPLSDRECYLEFSAYPVPEQQSLLIIMRSPTTKYLNIELPQPNPNVERMSVALGCLRIQYISPQVTKVSILVQANATVIRESLLPEWLLSFGKKQMMYFLMDSLRIAALNFRGSEYENRLQSKQNFYEFLGEFLHKDVEIL